MRNSDKFGPGQAPAGGGRVTNWKLIRATIRRFFYVTQDVFGWIALVLFLCAFVAFNAGYPSIGLELAGAGALSLLGALVGTEA